MKKLWQALKLVRRCDPWSFRRKLLYVILQSILPLVNLYILKLLVDSVTNAAMVHGVEPFHETALQSTMLLLLLMVIIIVFLRLLLLVSLKLILL